MSNPDPSTRERRTFQVVAAVLVLSLCVASYRAWTWSAVERNRNLVVVAPKTAHISIVDGPALLDKTQGVHTWSVSPGPLILEMKFAGEDTQVQRTKVIIPKGLGGLMLEVTQSENGELVLGYF